jgi:hypothetical protein
MKIGEGSVVDGLYVVQSGISALTTINSKYVESSERIERDD